jgi:hypothetical protein
VPPASTRDTGGEAERWRFDMAKVVQIEAGAMFGQLTVQEDLGMFPHGTQGKKARKVLCLCECGTETVVWYSNLVNGHTQSCGCLGSRQTLGERLRTHGETDTRLYEEWCGMLKRCRNPNCDDYHNYGGRGIKVYSGWRFSFRRFRDWALSHDYRDDLTIERKDVNGDYEPSNCTWIPKNQMARNTRKTVRLTAWGETKLLVDWVDDERCSVTRSTLYERVRKYGWDPERAISTPSMGSRFTA